MISTEPAVVLDSYDSGVQYETFSQQIRQRFAESVNKPMFTTAIDGLFDLFLAGLPAEHRQHYTCNACRQFVNRFGGLVTISEKGVATPVMWPDVAPKLFDNSVEAMRQDIKNASVTGVFLHGQSTWGTPVTGEWHHMSVINAPVYRHSLKTPFQAMAEKAEDFGILKRSLADFSQATVEQAVTLLKTESLYRSEKCLGVAEWLLKLHQSIAAIRNTRLQDNLIWLAVATAPTGYAHVRSSMIGTLLEDIASGMDFGAVSRRFAEKMSPANYQRSQVAPTVGAVQQAERLVKKLGLQNSLQRRYMTLDEIPAFVWRPHPVKVVSPGGVFAGVATKQPVAPSTAMQIPPVMMTWEKFQRTILPTATKIEVKAENAARFAALVTAVDQTAPNILQWDNGASWYYHGGVDAEMRRRVESAGGQYEGNEIRATLMWNNYTDLDLHCVTPNGYHIYYRDKQDRCGGWLDVDANGGAPQTQTPVENIRWAQAPLGNYQFYIHNYSERANGQNWYKAEIEVAGKVFAFEGMMGGTGSQIDLARFLYQRGVVPAIRGNSTVTNGTTWNLELNQFYPVAGIVKSPNLWGDKPVQHAGDHTFFLIDGCQDTEQGKGRGFFNEHLRPDLREIRKTLEAYTANTPIAESEAPACGLGFSKDSEWNVTLRVTSGSMVATYKLDRWD